MIWDEEPRKAYKKEQIMLIGKETGIEGHPFIPLQTPVDCPICGKRAWAKRQKSGEYITYCLKGCRPVKGQVVTIEPLKIKQTR